jgi:hypothetical protein
MRRLGPPVSSVQAPLAPLVIAFTESKIKKRTAPEVTLTGVGEVIWNCDFTGTTPNSYLGRSLQATSTSRSSGQNTR